MPLNDIMVNQFGGAGGGELDGRGDFSFEEGFDDVSRDLCFDEEFVYESRHHPFKTIWRCTEDDSEFAGLKCQLSLNIASTMQAITSTKTENGHLINALSL